MAAYPPDLYDKLFSYKLPASPKRYLHKGTGQEVAAMQYKADTDLGAFFAFTNAQSIETNLIKSDKSLVVCLVYANDLGKKNYLTFSPGDWIIRDDKDSQLPHA
jgi:general stress protein 26